MRNTAFRLALGAATILAGYSAAQADVTTKDAPGTGTLTFCGFSVSSVNLPCHVIVDSAKVEMFKAANPGMVGLAFGGSAFALGQKTKAGALGVVMPSDPDILNAAATITAADGASTSASGQNGVSVVSGTPTTGSVYSFAVNGQSEADFTVTGAFVGTLQFEGTANGGTTWTPRSAHVMGTKYRQTQITGPGVFHINAAGLTNIRVRAVALTSGTPSVQLNTTSGTGSIYVMNPVELSDNATGLSPSIKAGGSAALTDPAITVQNPNEAAALGTPADPAYTGAGNASQISVLKGLYGQAAATSVPGTSIGSTVPVPGIQGVTGGVPFGSNILVGGVAPSLAAPLPAQIAVGGVAASAANPLPVANSVAGNPVSSTNPMPVDSVVRATATPRSTILPVQESGDNVVAGGTGAAVGDVLTVVGGTLTPANATTGVAAGTAAKCTVTAVSSGAVTTCVPLSGSLGSYTAIPPNPVATNTTGTGSGATLNVTYAGLAIPVAPANPTRRGLHAQPQGGVAYLRGAGISATADYNAMKINSDALYETSPAFVGTGVLSMITSGVVPLGVFIAEY